MESVRFSLILLIALVNVQYLNAGITTCPNGYTGPTSEGFCYRAIFEAMTWNAAKLRCQRDDPRSHPAYVLDSQQNDDIVTYLVANKGKAKVCDISHANLQNYFIGGQRKDQNECHLTASQRSNVFEWIDGTTTIPFSGYTNWKVGEPNCSNGLVENCMAYRCGDQGLSDCHWIDYSCPSYACLVCQIDP